MASRMSEASYWDPQQSPQYHHPQHYFPSASSMIYQQQPRQPPLLNSLNTPEGHPTYSSSAPSNVYYGSLYQSTPMNGGGGGGSLGGHSLQSTSNSGGSQAGLSSMFVSSSPLVVPMSSSQVPYSMSSSSQHANSANGPYHRSHIGDLHNSGMVPVVDNSPHRSSHPASHHSGSPTMDGSEYGMSLKPKRRQVKNACINCQKACKRCDEGRPCTRCVKYGLTDSCQDSSRKERKRGIKRGPYKRRATTGSQPTSSTSHYGQSTFMGMDNMQHGSFLGHHSHPSMSPDLRSHREGNIHGMPGGDGSSALDSNLLSSPSYSSAPGTMQRSSVPLGGDADSVLSSNSYYARDQFQAMQPPRYTSRYEYERNGAMTTSPAPISSPYHGNRATAPGPPVSAPASSTNFSSSPASGYSSRSLFSPPAHLSAGFLSAHGHHRLHSDNSLTTPFTTGTTPGSSLSPRTPMMLSTNGQGLLGELGLMGTQPVSSNSSPGGFNAKSSGNGYVHHPAATTTASLAPTAAGAFLNSSSGPISEVQPFPLHIPHSVRWRSNSGGGGSDREERGQGQTGEEKEVQLVPMKMHSSADSDMSAQTLTSRHHSSSPRSANRIRFDRSGMAKAEMHNGDVMA